MIPVVVLESALEDPLRCANQQPHPRRHHLRQSAATCCRVVGWQDLPRQRQLSRQKLSHAVEAADPLLAGALQGINIR